MADLQDLKGLVVDQSKAIEAWKREQDERLLDLEKKLNRPGALGGATSAGTANLRELKAAMASYARTGSDVELKAMVTTSDPSGGYLMVPEWDNAVRLIRDRVSPLSGLCREVRLDNAAELILPYSRSALSGTWVDEQATRSATADPAFGQHRIPLRESYVCPAISQLLLDTAGYPIGDILVDMIGHGLATTEATALHTGDGVAQPMGFLSSTMSTSGDATRTLGEIQYVATGVSGGWHATTPATALITALGELAPSYVNDDTRWVMSRSTAASLRTIQADWGFVWQPGLAAGMPATILGIPVVIDDSMPAIAANSYSIALGDFKQAYCIARGGGLRLIRDNLTSKGSVLFYSFSRIGGCVVDDRAIKLIKFAS